MARSAEALVLRLLLALCAAAGAAAAAAAAPVRGCQPEVLASTVSLSCARGLHTEWCCLALAHAARVGGGASCLCRLAPARPLVPAGLNSTDLLKLHAACASRGGGGAAHKPSACDGEGALAAAAVAAPRDATGCSPAALADRMELFCGRGGWSTPNWPCCVTVVGSVRMGADGVPCFCHAALASASVDVSRVAALYGACGGSSHRGRSPPRQHVPETPGPQPDVAGR